MQNRELTNIIDCTNQLIVAAKALAAVLGCSQQKPIPLVEELCASMKNLQKLCDNNEMLKKGK